MGLLDRFRRAPDVAEDRQGNPLSWQAFQEWFFNNGNLYTLTGLPSSADGVEQTTAAGFAGYVAGLMQANGPVFTCMALRLRIFSDVRFAFRKITDGKPGQLTAGLDGRNPAQSGLRLLRAPEPGLTTGDLLAHMIQDVDLAGNAFVRRTSTRLQRLRPDWVTVVYGSRRDDASMWDLDAELIGYLYQEGGPELGRKKIALLPETVAHWAPQPDPLSPRMGMSWLTPIIREVLADSSSTAMKQSFFDNDATINQQLVIEKGATKEQFDEAKQAFNENHQGVANAYKTLILLGAKLEPVGLDFHQMEFNSLQGKAETRIAAAAGLHPVLVPFSEGLQGSSLNAGNFTSARRAVAGMTFRPLWRNACGSLAHIIDEPTATELWYDATDCWFLQEDSKDAAEIQEINARSIASLVREGFEPDSVVEAVMAQDMSLLKHNGLLSVQLHDPSAKPTPPALPPPNNGNGQPEPLPAAAG